MIKRSILPLAERILYEFNKMLFISGPRQSGKTTFAKDILRVKKIGEYLNWDIITDQKKIIDDPYFYEKLDRPFDRPCLLIYDEFHKYHKWKNYFKGAYDKSSEDFRFLVTGSGKLDIFKKGGDSLLGRYFSLQLFPLSAGELSGCWTTYQDFLDKLESGDFGQISADIFPALLEYGPFPEPFIRTDKQFLNLWRNERQLRLIREDIRDVTSLRQISMLEVLANLLPDRVGSPVSVNALRQELGVAFETTREWLRILEQFYFFFSVPAYSKRETRLLKKEKKIYLYDWTMIKEPGIRFENMIAYHLYKAVSQWNASGEGKITLHFIRDKEKREVDFLIANNGKPACLIECKQNDVTINKNLVYYMSMLGLKYSIQIVQKSGISRKIQTEAGTVWVISVNKMPLA